MGHVCAGVCALMILGGAADAVAAVPGAFGKLTPANGATGRLTAPTATWQASSGATSYTVCADTTNDNTCDTSWENVGNVTSVTWPGPELAHDTVYYWQVRAVNASGYTPADSQTWWSFRTRVDAPAAFNKSTPANGATGVSTGPTLSWAASTRATSYEVLLRHDERRGLRRQLGERGNRDERRGERAEQRDHVLLAGPRGGRGRHDVRGRQHVVEFDDGVSPARRLQQARGGRVGGRPAADLVRERPRGELRGTASTRRATPRARGPGPTSATPSAAVISSFAYNTTYYWQVRAVNAGVDDRGQCRNVVALTRRRRRSCRRPSTRRRRPIAGRRNSTAPTLSWAASARATSYEYLPRHDGRPLLFRHVDERGNGDERDLERPGRRDDLLLAGAGGERGWGDRGRQRDLVALHGGGVARSVRKDRPGERRDGRFDESDVDLGAERGGVSVLSLLRHDERRHVRRELDERGHGHERRRQRPEQRHHLLLARAGCERGRDDVRGRGSGVRSFTTVAQAPAAFGKPGPANGATGQATSLTLGWGTSAAPPSYEVLLRHDERQRMRRQLDEHRNDSDRRADRAERGHDVLLARAGAERGGDDVFGWECGDLLELHDAGHSTRSILQVNTDKWGDGGVDESDADVGDECAGDELRGTATTGRTTGRVAAAGRARARVRAPR